MKNIKILLILFVFSLFLMPVQVSAENEDNEKTDEFEFVELSKAEFIQHIATNNDISFEEATILVEEKDNQGFIDAANRGEIMPRGLSLRYGYFKAIFYTPSDPKPDPLGSTCAEYGVYASYYLPDANSSWASRKFNAIHDSFVLPNNNYTAVVVHSKSANITGSHNIKFSAIFDMKRNFPQHYYVKYTINHNFGL